ncbi:integrase core domain-containing protein [Mycobacterium malmoense]|uniref:integrase core domain-containing protein n=1 Tax=Mycobacterium malmoense TaxID=1780 RepID=UPI0009F6DFF1|nr:integrase core domain-containing protein [Mycobacterium malmoense]UNB96389.1 transposase [Mycobacterium malmoense]
MQRSAYKTELINRGRPWRCIDDVEFSTAEWAAWYNQERMHQALGYSTSRVRGRSHRRLTPHEPANPGPYHTNRNKTWGTSVRCETFTDVTDLQDAIRAYIDSYNQHAKPFTWTKTPDELLAKNQQHATLADGCDVRREFGPNAQQAGN